MTQRDATGRQKPIKVFVSYSRSDRDRVEGLYSTLSSKPGVVVLVDTHDISVAEDWQKRIEALVRQSDSIAYFLSAQSLQSDVCRWEIEFAASLNKRIIPVLLEDLDTSNIPAEVSKLNFMPAFDGSMPEDFAEEMFSILTTDIDWIREHTRISDLAHRWDVARKSGGQPLRGNELEHAEEWLASQPQNAPAPTPLQRDFIYQSRKATTQRQRLALGGSIFALLVVGVLAAFAVVQRNTALEGQRQAESAFNATQVATGDLIFSIVQRFRNTEMPRVLTYEVLQQIEYMRENTQRNFPITANVPRNTYIAFLEMGKFYREDGNFAKAENEYRVVLNALKSHTNQNDLFVLRDKIVTLNLLVDVLTENQGASPELMEKRSTEADALLSEIQYVEDRLKATEYYGFGDIKSELGTVGTGMQFYLARDEYDKVAALLERARSIETQLSTEFAGNELLEIYQGELLWNGMIHRRTAAVSYALDGGFTQAVEIIDEAIAMFDDFEETFTGQSYSTTIKQGFLSDLQNVKGAIQAEASKN